MNALRKNILNMYKFLKGDNLNTVTY